MFTKFAPVYAPEGTEGGGVAGPSTPSAPASPPVEPSSPSGVPNSGSSASEPVPPAPSPESGTGSPPATDVDDPFGFIAALGDDELPGSAPEAPSASPTPAPEPEVPAPVPAAAKPPTPTAPEPKTPEPAKVEPPATPGTSPPLDLSEPAALALAMQENSDAVLQEFAEKYFKLSPEDVEAMESDLVAATPRLAAKIMFQSQQATLNMLARILPAMLTKHQSATKQNEANANRFYDRWKDVGITREKHGAMVTRTAQLYRELNPQATLEQMIEDLGPIVVQQAKLAPPAPTSTTPMVKPAPFVPAVGSPPMGANTLPQPSEWEMLGQVVED